MLCSWGAERKKKPSQTSQVAGKVTPVRAQEIQANESSFQAPLYGKLTVRECQVCNTQPQAGQRPAPFDQALPGRPLILLGVQGETSRCLTEGLLEVQRPSLLKGALGMTVCAWPCSAGALSLFGDLLQRCWMYSLSLCLSFSNGRVFPDYLLSTKPRVVKRTRSHDCVVLGCYGNVISCTQILLKMYLVEERPGWGLGLEHECWRGTFQSWGFSTAQLHEAGPWRQMWQT